MVRRVKAYLSQKRVIVSEDELMQLSQKIGECQFDEIFL